MSKTYFYCQGCHGFNYSRTAIEKHAINCEKNPESSYVQVTEEIRHCFAEADSAKEKPDEE